MDVRQELAGWLRVYAPALWIRTREERRAVDLLRELAKAHAPQRKILIWSATRGLREHEAGLDPATQRLSTALEQIHDDMHDGRIVALLDPDLTSHAAARGLRDVIGRAGPGSRTLVVISPGLARHDTLDQVFIPLTLPPPGAPELGASLDAVVERFRAGAGTDTRLSAPLRERLATAAQGMTVDECERASLKILLERRHLGEGEIALLQAEKCRRVANHPLLRLETVSEDLEDIGGMAAFKTWLLASQEMVLRGEEPLGRAFRGLLLVGLPGCGQAVSVRAAVRAWGLPLLQLDGMDLSPAAGASPLDVERALEQVEACQPVVLWLPRIDAAFEGDGDQGGRAASAGALVLERWLLDRGRRAVVVATARDPERLPLTMVVRGAFDKTFFLDFPNSDERRQILGIILRKRGVDVENLNIEMLVAASDGFSGAQIVQAIDRGLLESQGGTEPLKMVDLLHSLRQATPMAGYLGDARRRIKAWAHRWALSVSAPREGG